MSITLEQKLWQDVQRAYANQNEYRAGNNPEFAKVHAKYFEALAASEGVPVAADQPAVAADQPSNVLLFKRRGAK
jgi:hypothetical protein